MQKRKRQARAEVPPEFNNEERRAAVSVLRKTEKLLSREPDDKKIRMLCPAIDKAVRKLDTIGAVDVGPKLQQLIKIRLDGASNLRHWLAARGIKEAYSEDPAVYRKVQDTRHQWVADLIKEIGHEQVGKRQDVPHKKRALRPDYSPRSGLYIYDEPDWVVFPER